MREVLVENKARWRQPTVRAGNRVFLTLPGVTTGPLPTTCTVTAPSGDEVELEVRRRDDGLTRDCCAVLDGIAEDGRHRYVWTFDDGRTARGSFHVGTPERPAKGRKPGKPRRR
ncbi:MAG TPA: hypothetical protein VHR18_13455 [Solirubrobacterales bacterium]|jgi:hypothetical protein|nr:hypothetical protein [Solirubrobacterales bacterium]